MTSRQSEIKDFLNVLGWADAERKTVPGDASTRRYERLSRAQSTREADIGNAKNSENPRIIRAILMDAPKESETPSEPEGASIATRKALGYNATARLAGSDMRSFIAVAEALTQRGFSAPKIYGADIEKGLILLEDFGDPVYARKIENNLALERPLYEAAIDTLASLYRSSFPEVLSFKKPSAQKRSASNPSSPSPSSPNPFWRIRDYDKTAMLAETDLCLDWFAQDYNRVITPEAREEFYSLWSAAFEVFKVHAQGLCLRDFHAENLFWLEARKGTERVGLIDFQDALWAHPAYDLASLTEDIRRDVSTNLTDPLIERFCDQAGLDYNADFLAAYAVAGGQRNTKLLGFPVRADLKFNKPQYRALLPRVKRHFQNSLKHDALLDIKIWFETNLPDALKAS